MSVSAHVCTSVWRPYLTCLPESLAILFFETWSLILNLEPANHRDPLAVATLPVLGLQASTEVPDIFT